MLNFDSLFSDLDDLGLRHWRQTLEPLLAQKLAPGVHGQIATWQSIIDQLPAADELCVRSHPDAVDIAGPHLAAMPGNELHHLLLQLAPWRKGPFNIEGIEVDTEWRSNLKWDRIKNHIEELAGRLVLDVGSGNGYYACRMHAAGARYVLGIDPTLLFVCQFAAIKKISGIRGVEVLPVRLHELPGESAQFDTTFSMGILYHQRNPSDHLEQLKRTLRSDGQLVLETLVLPGSENEVLQPCDRYARMRNVWHLPTLSALIDWVEKAGFSNPQVIDVTTTTVNEQRTTDWMPFESLAEALDPTNATLTIEGLPAPTRAVLVCHA